MLASTWKWWRRRTNPVRQQAQRVLAAFNSHGFSCTQINKLLPQQLRLPASCWSTPDQLQHHLTQEHIDWVNELFALEPHWLEGTSDAANSYINSYKTPAELHHWLAEQRKIWDQGHIRLYFITQFAQPYDAASRGYFALIIEHLLDTEEEGVSRFYHLSEGAHFDHGPCLLHLAQVLAIAHFHYLDMRRATLDEASIERLSLHRGLIPDWLSRTNLNELNADHEFWQHFSGSSPWLEQIRQDCELSLVQAGLNEVVLSIRHDRIRFARPSTIGSLITEGEGVSNI